MAKKTLKGGDHTVRTSLFQRSAAVGRFMGGLPAGRLGYVKGMIKAGANCKGVAKEQDITTSRHAGYPVVIAQSKMSRGERTPMTSREILHVSCPDAEPPADPQQTLEEVMYSALDLLRAWQQDGYVVRFDEPTVITTNNVHDVDVVLYVKNDLWMNNRHHPLMEQLLDLETDDIMVSPHVYPLRVISDSGMRAG